jgi:hypothetical protein
MRYISTYHRPETLIYHCTSFTSMSSSRQRRVNNHDVCDQKQRFSKCFLSLDMTRSLTRGIRHFSLIINLLVDRRSKKNKALHCPYNVQGHRANEATGKTPYAAPATGGRDEYSKLWLQQGHISLLTLLNIYILPNNSLSTSTIKWKVPL